MNTKDRRLIYRLMQLIDKIPAGHTGLGGPSIDIGGVVRAHCDFVEARTAMRLFVREIIDAGDGNPGSVVDTFEKWINQRSASNWQGPSPDFYLMYYEGET